MSVVGSLLIGTSASSKGTLSITNCGLFTSTNNVGIGQELGTTGSVYISGNCSTLTCLNLTASKNGQGSLTVINGGSVNAYSFSLGLNSGSSGIAVFDGAGGGLPVFRCLNSYQGITDSPCPWLLRDYTVNSGYRQMSMSFSLISGSPEPIFRTSFSSAVTSTAPAS